MLTLGLIIERCSELIGGVSLEKKQTTLLHYINQCYEEIYDLWLWPATVRKETLSLVSTTGSFVLPKYIGALLRLADTATGRDVRIIDPLAFSDAFLTVKINQVTSGLSPVQAVTSQGVLGVAADTVTTAQALKISSSSASDTYNSTTGAGSLFIMGIGSANQTLSETLQLNGTTAVTTTNSYRPDTCTFSKQGKTVGVITVTDNAGTTTLATIDVWEVSPVYRRYAMSETLGQDTGFYMTYKLRFTPLFDLQQRPIIRCSRALIHGATALAFVEGKNSEMAAMHQNLYNAAIDQLRQREGPQDGAAQLAVSVTRC